MNGASAREAVSHRDFTTLYVDHHSWLQNWLYRRIRCRSDAADLAQDTFLRLFRTSSAPLAPDLRQPRAYLATLAKRLMLNLYRRRSVEEAWLQTLADYSEQTALSVEEQWLIREALQSVDALLQGLQPVVRRAFLMSQLEGYTYAEIATTLNVTVRTVQRYLTKAMEQCMVLAMMDTL